MEFDPGFGIRPVYDPMGFSYEADCLGPAVENRTLDAIRGSLKDPGTGARRSPIRSRWSWASAATCRCLGGGICCSASTRA